MPLIVPPPTLVCRAALWLPAVVPVRERACSRYAHTVLLGFTSKGRGRAEEPEPSSCGGPRHKLPATSYMTSKVSLAMVSKLPEARNPFPRPAATWQPQPLRAKEYGQSRTWPADLTQSKYVILPKEGWAFALQSQQMGMLRWDARCAKSLYGDLCKNACCDSEPSICFVPCTFLHAQYLHPATTM